MTVVQGSVSRAPRPSSLADVLDLILDKGLVIDAYVRVSVVGIEILTIDARVVIASVDTYLHFAEAVNRLELGPDKQGLTELFGDDSSDERSGDGSARSANGDGGGGGGSQRRRGSAQRAVERGGDDSDEEDEESERGHGLVGRIAERGKRE